jgi:hypothetical protein
MQNQSNQKQRKTNKKHLKLKANPNTTPKQTSQNKHQTHTTTYLLQDKNT